MKKIVLIMFIVAAMSIFGAIPAGAQETARSSDPRIGFDSDLVNYPSHPEDNRNTSCSYEADLVSYIDEPILVALQIPTANSTVLPIPGAPADEEYVYLVGPNGRFRVRYYDTDALKEITVNETKSLSFGIYRKSGNEWIKWFDAQDLASTTPAPSPGAKPRCGDLPPTTTTTTTAPPVTTAATTPPTPPTTVAVAPPTTTTTAPPTTTTTAAPPTTAISVPTAAVTPPQIITFVDSPVTTTTTIPTFEIVVPPCEEPTTSFDIELSEKKVCAPGLDKPFNGTPDLTISVAAPEEGPVTNENVVDLDRTRQSLAFTGVSVVATVLIAASMILLGTVAWYTRERISPADEFI